MEHAECVILTRYIKALCPAQAIDEYTADAWHDLLATYSLAECRKAAAVIATRQPFIAAAELIAAVKTARAERIPATGAGMEVEVPNADPDDVAGYLAALRAQRARAAAGEDVPTFALPARDDFAGRQPHALVSNVIQGSFGRPALEAASSPRPSANPRTVACSWCGARETEPCQTPKTGTKLTAYHDSRVQAAKGITVPAPEVAP